MGNTVTPQPLSQAVFRGAHKKAPEIRTASDLRAKNRDLSNNGYGLVHEFVIYNQFKPCLWGNWWQTMGVSASPGILMVISGPRQGHEPGVGHDGFLVAGRCRKPLVLVGPYHPITHQHPATNLLVVGPPMFVEPWCFKLANSELVDHFGGAVPVKECLYNHSQTVKLDISMYIPIPT
jgi:hypothetical protein